MSEQEFELYLKLLSRCLNLTPGQREQIADELRDHLEARLEELAEAGVPREKAVVQALDEFGDAAILAGNFASVARLKRRRFFMRLSLGSVGALTAALLIAYAFWPENRAVRGPEHVVAQEKPSPGPPPAQKPTESKASPSPRPSELRGGLVQGSRPPVVEVCRPVTKKVTDDRIFSGLVQPSQFLQIQSQATGHLRAIHFRPGQAVKRGDLLFEIDPTIYLAEVDKAAAELARSQARLEYARTQFRRVQQSFKAHTVAPEELDKAASECRVAEADDQVARTTLELAKVRLSYTRITAAIDGHISRSSFGVGSLVRAEGSALATIVCLDPVCALINVDETTWFALRKRVRKGEFQGSEIPVDVDLLREGEPVRKALLEFVDDAAFDQGNSTTTSMRVRTPNADSGLVPGLGVHVRYATGKPHSGLLVPATAKAQGSAADGRRTVWVVDDDNRAQFRWVRIAPFPHEGGQLEITEGLKPDEWIACRGNDPHLKEGKQIEPKRVP
ncbi:MAG TPA: efflux RND transporter periplasmic adaptor subunit [Planctomycetaceae bacterium]|jgi:multidrug efflux system membrane fusion protein|nr:efflux RND transporter periplasmic adaptor subunit [Planctomycetaceae bacterium]